MVEVRAIRESEREECLRLWQTVWPGDGTGYFERYFYGDVEWLPYYTRVCLVEGRIVSAVHICKRTVACGDFRLTMGGIANVATLPDQRGKGYNTACLQQAIGIMEADSMDFSLLFTGITGYYAREGYAPLSMRNVSGRVSPGAMSSPSAYKTRGAQADDLPAIQAIYNRYNHTRPFTVQRYPAYWRDWMRLTPTELQESVLVSADDNGTVTGYVAFTGGPDEFFLTELGLEGDESERSTIARSLMAGVVAKAHGKQPRLSARVAFDAPVLSALQHILEPEEWQTDTHGMVRLLHRENLFRSLVMEWNDRWRQAGRPQGTLDFVTPYGITRLQATDTFLRVEADDNLSAANALSQETFFGLLFGLMTPEQATPERELYPLLAALFPGQDAIYWHADGF